MNWYKNLSKISLLWRRKLYRRCCWIVFAVSLGFTIACSETAPPTLSISNVDSPPACGSPLGGPKDNPLQQFYGPAAFSWANQIRWQCVYNIKDFAGPSDNERYLAARSAAIEDGGGVIYLPADIYYFLDDLPLGDNIVLRGDPPEQPNAKADGFKPPTRLVFPKYEPSRSGEGTPNETAFKKIITPNPDTDSNVGLIFLDIDRGAIDLTGNADTGTMKNRLVFSVRSNNVAEPAPSVPDTSFQPSWLRYSHRQAANIRLTTSENALVANNRLNDAITDAYDQSSYVAKTQDGSIVSYLEGERVPFSYTDHHGIVLNRSKPDGFTFARSGEDEPGLFRPGITVQDNWVFKTMGAGIQAAGEGLTIRRNVVSDMPGKVAWVDPTGTRQPDKTMSFENQAIDWSGHNVTIEGNNFVVYRHKIMDTPDASADGDGIVIQPCCGGTSVNGVVIRNNIGKGSIEMASVSDVQRVLIEENKITPSDPSKPAINVQPDPSDDSNTNQPVQAS